MTDQNGSGTPAPQEGQGNDTLTGGAGGGGTPAAWHSGYDDETRGWLENRGLHQKKSDEALAELVKTARSAEKKFGVPQDRLLTLPANFDEEGVLEPIYDRLGRPKTFDEYGIKIEGDDELGADFAKKFSERAHKAGLSTAQAKDLFKFIDETTTAIFEKDTGAAETQRAAEMVALEQEWGDSAAMNKLIAQEAAKATGADKEEIEALTKALGSDAKVIKFFARLGAKRSGEAPFISADNPAIKYGATTPEAARAKLDELRGDPEWRGKYRKAMDDPHGGASAVMKEYRALAAIAASGA